MSDKMQILVCQHGARRRYAVPRMMEQAGVLSAFYTDSHAESFLGKLASWQGRMGTPSMRRLAKRKIEGVPPEKIFSCDLYHVCEFFQRITGLEKTGTDLLAQRYRLLSRRMKRQGDQGSQAVYSMYHENLDFIRWAKACGMRSIVDVYISPVSHRIVAEEYEDFPEWGMELDDADAQREQNWWFQTEELADILLCPSAWVAAGVRSLSPNAADKIRIVPYGCSINFQGRTNQPSVGRVLFAGGAPLRKGLRYLAQAATRLKPSIPSLDIRVAGLLPDAVVSHPLCKDLDFLGKLTTEQMKNEFLCADVFVLPSLSEGFAGVVAEAIGAGCPVIVTEEAGSPVVHGREGLIVPARDSEALVDAIRLMILDREFRQKCSGECLAQAPFYSEPVWRRRLIDALFPEENTQDDVVPEFLVAEKPADLCLIGEGNIDPDSGIEPRSGAKGILVSVVMPTYKRLAMLKRAVESVFDQTHENWELVVSDNEDPPGETWEYLLQLSKTSDKVTVLRNDGGEGVASNLNNALRHVRGEWVKPLFDDDVLMPTCLEEFLSAVSGHPTVAMAGCLSYRARPGKRVRGDRRPTRADVEIVEQRYAHLAMYLQDYDCGGQPTDMFIRKSVLDAGAFMPVLPAVQGVDDSYWFAEILRYGDRLHLARPLVKEYQGGHVSITSTLGADVNEVELAAFRRHILQYIPSEQNPPPCRAVEQMVYGIRGLYKMFKLHDPKGGMKGLAKVRDPKAFSLLFKWCLRRTFRGRFTATPRLRYPLWASARLAEITDE